MNNYKEMELFEVAKHLVVQRLENYDYYSEELIEQYEYSEEDIDLILDKVYQILQDICIKLV